LKILLTLIAVLSGLVSIFLFFFWIPVFGSLFINWDISNPIDEAIAAYKQSNFKLLFYIFRQYFAVIAGLPGWVALFSLCFYVRREWRNLPKWIPIGCLLGTAAVLVGPYHFSLVIPPISLAMSVLLLIKFKTRPVAM
jgi:hypothetical protein